MTCFNLFAYKKIMIQLMIDDLWRFLGSWTWRFTFESSRGVWKEADWVSRDWRVCRQVVKLTFGREEREALADESCNEPVKEEKPVSLSYKNWCCELQTIIKYHFIFIKEQVQQDPLEIKRSLTHPRLCWTPIALHSLSVIKWLLGTSRARSLGSITWLRKINLAN